MALFFRNDSNEIYYGLIFFGVGKIQKNIGAIRPVAKQVKNARFDAISPPPPSSMLILKRVSNRFSRRRCDIDFGVAKIQRDEWIFLNQHWWRGGRNPLLVSHFFRRCLQNKRENRPNSNKEFTFFGGWSAFMRENGSNWKRELKILSRLCCTDP